MSHPPHSVVLSVAECLFYLSHSGVAVLPAEVESGVVPRALPGRRSHISLHFCLASAGYGKQLLTVLLHLTGSAPRAEGEGSDIFLISMNLINTHSGLKANVLYYW